MALSRGVSSTTSAELLRMTVVMRDSTLKIYVNGTLENSATISGKYKWYIVCTNCQIGRMPWASQYKGFMRDFIISANQYTILWNVYSTTDRLVSAITDTQFLPAIFPILWTALTHGHTNTMNHDTNVAGFSLMIAKNIRQQVIVDQCILTALRLFNCRVDYGS